MNTKKVWVVGHRGMVGSSVSANLQKKSEKEVIEVSRDKLDLLRQKDVEDFVKKNHIDEIVLCAAKVGGIYANDTYPAEFIYENLMIECNVINAAKMFDVPKLLFLGSSCIYPKYSKQPISESELLKGELEPTNQWYALAKISGLKLCESYQKQYGLNYFSAMPTNLYGPNDNFHLENSHVIPALLKKCHSAKINNEDYFEIWGSGNAMREFLHVDDLAEAISLLLKQDDISTHVNVGSGEELSIRDLAYLIAEIVGFKGEIIFDSSKPDGTPRKLLNSNKILNLGWHPKYDLKSGLAHTYSWYLENFFD